MSGWALLVTLLMVLGQAFFVAYEFSVVAVRQHEVERLAAKGHRGARRVLRQLEQVDGYLAACQFGITLTGLALTAAFEPAVQAVLTPLLQAWMPQSMAASLSVVVAVGTATAVMVVFGELFPKTVAITVPVPIVLATSGPMRWAYLLSTPLNATYNRAANFIVKLLTGKSVQEAHSAESFDAEVLLRLAYEQGRIDDEQHELMNAVLEFPTRTAREVMTPAHQVVGFDLSENAETVYRRMQKARFARYPVFDGEELVGYVLMHDLFRQRLEGRFDLKAVLRDIVRVPETVHLDRLHAEYREHPIMAVFDERNQFVGIITAEDLLEEIVGEILDEDEEPERPVVQRLNPGTVLIDATALIEDVCSELDLRCDAPDGVDTFGGLLLSRLGREPKPGDVIPIPPWSFVVKECKGFSIRVVEGKGPAAQRPQQQGGQTGTQAGTQIGA